MNTVHRKTCRGIVVTLALFAPGLGCTKDLGRDRDASSIADVVVARDAAFDSGTADVEQTDAANFDGRADGGGGHDASARDARAYDVGVWDAGTDDSLAGTPLDGISIEWNASLELCSEWGEGRPLATELAAKVQITLPPQHRPSLACTGAASIFGGRCRSPLAQTSSRSTTSSSRRGSPLGTDANGTLDDHRA